MKLDGDESTSEKPTQSRTLAGPSARDTLIALPATTVTPVGAETPFTEKCGSGCANNGLAYKTRQLTATRRRCDILAPGLGFLLIRSRKTEKSLKCSKYNPNS